MTIDDIKLTAEESLKLEKLTDDFIFRNGKSPAKKAHLAREIKGYSLIFDEDNLPIPVLLDDDEPLADYPTPEFCSIQI
jgi:hypothetical protein